MRKEHQTLISLAAAVIISVIHPRIHAEETMPKEHIEQTIPNGVEQLRQELEARYGIEILNRTEVIRETNPGTISTTGQMEHLELLDRFLPLLPKHLYSTGLAEERVRFVLSQPMGLYAGGCECPGYLPDIDRASIILSESQFTQNHETSSFSLLTHELVHRVTPIVRTDEDKGLPTLSSPWFDKIDEIVGGSYLEIRPEILEHISTAQTNLLATLLHTKRRETLFFLGDLRYAFGRNPQNPQRLNERYPIEFIATLSQHYIAGRSYFFRMYSLVFDEVSAEKFYTFMRDEVFDGWEYENFIPIEQAYLSIPYPSPESPLIFAARTTASRGTAAGTTTS